MEQSLSLTRPLIGVVYPFGPVLRTFPACTAQTICVTSGLTKKRAYENSHLRRESKCPEKVLTEPDRNVIHPTVDFLDPTSDRMSSGIDCATGKIGSNVRSTRSEQVLLLAAHQWEAH